MNLNPYIENVQRQLEAAGATGGEEARDLAERLAPALEAAVRLALQDALAAAVDEITCELAPGSVALRLRGRDPEFVVSAPPADAQTGAYEAPVAIDPADAGQGAMSRINLRMPVELRMRIEAAAGTAGLSANAWLVRAAAAAVERSGPEPHKRAAAQGSQRYTGWAR